MKIDAHQHFWKYDQVKHAWITDEMKLIRRDFPPNDLFPLLQELKIDGTVAVQADETWRETEYLLDLADQYSWIKAVVGWVNVAGKDLEEYLDHASSLPKLKGFREILQAQSPEYILRPEFVKGIQKLGKLDFTYDILIFPEHLDASLQLVSKCPDQLFVIDHLAKPNIKTGEWKEWRKKMALLAERELVYCKLSGMITEADLKKWNYEDILPYMEIALDLFGPQKLMFGSDWPVCLVAGEYERVWETVNQFTDALSAGEKERIFGGTAQEFYRISE
jgi:L-fuconolactonase